MAGEYAKAGVDYEKIDPFKQIMVEMGNQTLAFPNRRGVFINDDVLHAHGAVYEYRGGLPHIWCKTQEGLGNKNWIAEWMYQFAGTGKTYYEGVAIDTLLMAVNDVIAQGAMPTVYTDEVAAGDSEWFTNEKRSTRMRLLLVTANGLQMRREVRILLKDVSRYVKWLAWLCRRESHHHSVTLLKLSPR